MDDSSVDSSPLKRMLTVEEVLGIFEHVHHNRSLPPGIEYQVIPVDPNGSKITPPPLDFQAGLFLLCDITDTPHFPQHLLERVSHKPMDKINFHWHPAKKGAADLVQMRNCYRYNHGNVGGSAAYIWTLTNDEKEDLQYRLFHVLPSKKVTTARQKQPGSVVKSSPPPHHDAALTREACRLLNVLAPNKATVPESKTAPKQRAQRTNRDAGTGDEKRRIGEKEPSPNTNMSEYTLQPGDFISSPRPEDVASTRDRKWHKRPSNELFRSLIIKAAQTTDMGDSQAVKSISERIVDIIMVDRKGMFVKSVRDEDDNKRWEVMDRKESVNKASQAIRNWKTKDANGGWYTSKASIARKQKKNDASKKKKKPQSHSTTTRKKRIVYQAQAGAETSIHPYALLLISAVCNHPHEVLRVLQSPLHGIFEDGRTETCSERAMRLQLRHRFVGALSTGITPQTFSKRLLEIWGGSLVQSQESSSILNTGESQKVTQAEKEAEQDMSEDGNHDSWDADRLAGTEGEQTSTDAEEDSDGSE